MSTANTEIPCTKFYNKPRKMSNKSNSVNMDTMIRVKY